MLPQELARGPRVACADYRRLATRGSPLLGVTAPRRFPPPCDIEQYDQRYFIVRDNNRMALAYVEAPGRLTARSLNASIVVLHCPDQRLVDTLV